MVASQSNAYQRQALANSKASLSLAFHALADGATLVLRTGQSSGDPPTKLTVGVVLASVMPRLAFVGCAHPCLRCREERLSSFFDYNCTAFVQVVSVRCSCKDE